MASQVVTITFAEGGEPMPAGTPVPYNNARYLIGSGALDLSAGDIKMLLVTSSYTPDNDTHEYLDDITNEVTGNGYARQTLTYGGVTRWAKGTNKSRFTSADVSFAASGGSIVARRAVIFKDTGVAGTSPLVAHFLLDATPADVTIADGNTLVVSPDATQGWVYV